MKKNKHLFLLAIILFTGCAMQSASINYSQKSERFSALKSNLETFGEDDPNDPNVADLLRQSSDISEMNDHCKAISLTDKLDPKCEIFYSVELPAFEKKYSEVSNQVLSRKIATNYQVADKVRQINNCVEALGAFFINPSDVLEFRQDKGFYNFIPLDRAGLHYRVNYEFSVVVNRDIANDFPRMANAWRRECWDVVRDKDESFIEVFVKGVDNLNDRKRAEGSKTRVRIDSDRYFHSSGRYMELKTRSEHIVLYVNIPNYLGSYYLNGEVLFNGRGDGGNLDLVAIGHRQHQPDIVVGDLLKFGNVDRKDGTFATFTGTVEASSEEQINGYWIWNF